MDLDIRNLKGLMRKLVTALCLLICAVSAFGSPTISNVLVTGMTATTATIQWNTSTPSNSSLKYGTDPSLPYQNPTNPSMVTSHTMTLTLLSAGPYYYVAALSTDNSGTTQSATINFTLCGTPLTPVQGTVTNYYQYGSYVLTWVPPAGASQPPMVCGQAVTTTVTGQLDGGASFNTQVADSSKVVPGPGQWQVTVTDAGNIAPLTVFAPLSQVTQNVSAQLQTAAATGGLQACLTNTLTSQSWPSSCGSGPGGGSPGGNVGAIQYKLNGTTFGGVNISGIVLGNGSSAPSAATGSRNGTGDFQLPITFNCTGAINCTLASNTWNVTYSGPAGSGAVNSANAYQVGCYPAAGTTIGGCPNIYALNPGMSLSQINTLFSSLTAGQDVVVIPPGVPQLGWTNHAPITAIDLRQGASLIQMGSEGIACDGQQTPFTVSLTQGVSTVNVGSLVGAANDVGKTMTFASHTGYLYNSPQYYWTAQITGYTFPNFTLSAPAPFAFSGFAWYGTDNTSNAQAALNSAGPGFPLSIPAGCLIMVTSPIQLTGQSIIGQQANSGGFLGTWQDILQQPDHSGGGNSTSPGQRLENFEFVIDSGVDPTQVTGGPLTVYNATGTPTSIAPLYRPLYELSPLANNPCGPAWILNCANGVASTTQGSAVICVPTALGRVPTVGETIMFPYFKPVFTATVNSNTGAGCAGGFSGSTMSAALPNTSGYTVAQAEWFTGTQVQSTTTTIPTTITYPLTLTLTMSTAFVPGSEYNFASHGHVSVCGIEGDYMGGNTFGPYTIVLRRGPTSSAGCSGTTPIAPLNPCPARNLFGSSSDLPYPVIPSINAGDSTPSGANWYPGECGGSAAISFPQANANVYSTTGFTKAFLENLYFTVTSTQDTNGVQEYYSAGDAGPYAVDMGGWNGLGMMFGITQGPASAGQHGIGPTGPTGTGNTIHNFTFYGAYPFTFVNFQQSSIDRADTYSTEISPFDGTAVGGTTCIHFGYTLDEQTGAVITVTAQDPVKAWNCEPENGSHIEVNPNAVTDGAQITYDNVNFEGVLNIFGGQNNTVTNSYLALPSINYGSANDFENVGGSNAGLFTNVWSTQAQFYNWGKNSKCGAFSGGTGTSVACGSGFAQGYQGHSMEASVTGNVTHPYENSLGGMVTPGWNTSSALDSLPMSVGYAVDPTEPFWGAYQACNLGGGAQCQVYHFSGLNDVIYVGPHNRIVDAPYDLAFDMKSAAASSTVRVQIVAEDSGSGQCTNPAFPLADTTISTTTSWQSYTLPVDFTTRAGCVMAVHLFSASTTDQFRVGYFNFAPVPMQILLPTATPTVGAGCSGPNAIIGSNSSGPLSCIGGVVVAGSGSGSAITQLTGDVTATGPGMVASHVVSIGGGSLSFNGLMQITAGVASQATQVNVSGSIQAGTSLAAGLDTVTSSATPVFNGTIGNTHYLQLTSNVTSSSFTAGPGGSIHFFKVCQDTTGGRTFSWPSNFSGFPSVTLTASACTTALASYDISANTMWGDQFNAAQCVNSASTNVPCGAATKGYIAVPAGTNSVLTVLTTAVATASGFVLTPTPGAGSLLGITCNATPPSLGQAIVSWTAGTGFNVETYGTTSGSPECYFWSLVNQ